MASATAAPRPEPTMTVLTRPSQLQGRQRTQGGGEAAGHGIVGFPRCLAQSPPPELAVVPSGDADRPSHSYFVSSLEKTADDISQDPVRYSRLRHITSSTHSERARVFLNLANEFREQRWIELERTRIGEARRPLFTEARGAQHTPTQSRPERGRSATARPARENPNEAGETLRAVQRVLADEEDEAPLLPPREGDGDSD